MYQAVHRLMAEANPMKTQRLFQRSIMRQRSTCDEKIPSKCTTVINYFFEDILLYI